MKDLLAKIREATEQKDAQTKCALVAQVYKQMTDKLEKLDSDVDATVFADAGRELDVEVFDARLDELEFVCVELIKILNPELQKALKFLKPRFESHMYRHEKITWEQVEKRLLEAEPKKLWSLNEMERTGGEPDVVGLDKKTGELIFQDRSAESPTGRRNCAYDKDAEEQLKRDNPNKKCNGNAVDMAAQMGVELLDEQEYREAQKIDKLDQNTWSWLKTPIDKRRKGVALYGSRNGADVDVYGRDPRNHPAGARGWRGRLRV